MNPLKIEAELRYYKIERLALVVVTRVRELRPYIQDHHIVVKTNHPTETDINFVPHESVKSHVLSNFLVELNSPISEDTPHEWILLLDESLNLKGSSVGVLLEGPNEKLIEKSLQIKFKASKNHEEYKTLITVMTLAMEMRIIIFEKKVTLNW